MCSIPPATNGRRARPPESRRRGGAGTAVYDGKIYLACGIMDGHTSGTVAWFDEFDPATGEWTELPDALRARNHFSAVVSDGQLYLVGGRNTSYHEPDNFTAIFDEVVPEVDVYDFSTGAGRPCRPSCLCRPSPVGLRLSTDRSTTSVARQGRTWRIRTRIVSTEQRGNGIRPALRCRDCRAGRTHPCGRRERRPRGRTGAGLDRSAGCRPVTAGRGEAVSNRTTHSQPTSLR